MDYLSFFRSAWWVKGSFANKQYEQQVLNNFFSTFGGKWTVSEFLDAQKDAQKMLPSYSQKNSLSLDALNNSPEAKAIMSQIKTQASLQAVQNFYDMYMSPVGNTDVYYRLGRVSGAAPAGTVNNQTDAQGRMQTRSLFTNKVEYNVYLNWAYRNRKDYYSVMWFPPYVTPNIKKPLVAFENSDIKMSLADFIKATKKGKKEKEEEDTRLQAQNGSYYETYDMNTFLCARSTFTYREPGFKAINDNVHMLQWIFEGVSGIVSTYLTEWDISLYLQEGMITGTNGLLPEVISLTHRMADDNPSHFHDNRANTYGVINCAVSKAFGHNEDAWFINSHPFSAYWSEYPDWKKYGDWSDKTFVEDFGDVYFPRFYTQAKQGLSVFLRKYGNTLKNKIIFQDFEGAALSGYDDWRFRHIWKALYTSEEDSFSDLDIIFLPTSSGVHRKVDLINDVMTKKFFIDTSLSEGDDSYRGNDTQNSRRTDENDEISRYGGGSGSSSGGKKLPFFIKLFRNKKSKSSSAMRAAKSGSRNVFSSMTGNSTFIENEAGKEVKDDAVLGVSKNYIDNAVSVGVPQYNPTLYGGPHGYYKSPKSVASYFEENNNFLRNTPRACGMPKNSNGEYLFDKVDSYTTRTMTYFQGAEKWCTEAVSKNLAIPQCHEQSWSAGYSRLRQGIHCWSWDSAYLGTKIYTKIYGKYVKNNRYWWWSWTWWWWPWKRWRIYDEYKIEWPERAPNGEKYNFDAGYTKEWVKSDTWDHYYFFRWRYWDDYYYYRYSYWDSYYYNYRWVGEYIKHPRGWGWIYRVNLYQYKPVAYVWHWRWEYRKYKRYALHSDPYIRWNIIQTQSNSVYVNPNARSFRHRWRSWWCRLFGWAEPYVNYYVDVAVEDYKLNIPGGGFYTYNAFTNEKTGATISVIMTGKEHEVMDKMVDWKRGVGAKNHINFMTRDSRGNPDVIFRAEVEHALRPITYWVECSRRYSSSRTSYWWEKRYSWQHYMKVHLHRTDRFFAGISKYPFSSRLTWGSNIWDVATPNPWGNYTEHRRSPFDIIKENGSFIAQYNYYNAATGNDETRYSAKGIQGYGLFGSLQGLTLDGDDTEVEKFSDKVSIQDTDRERIAFKELLKRGSFYYWSLDYYDAEIKEIGGNTWRKPGGFPVHSKHRMPRNIAEAMLRFYLRNTFFRDSNGPLIKAYDFRKYNMEVTGLSDAEVRKKIALSDILINAGGGEVKVLESDIISWTTYQKDTVTQSAIGIPMPGTVEMLDKVTLKLFAGGVYTLCSIDCAPRLLYNQLNIQIAYLKFAKDFFCGRDPKTGKRIFDFNFVKKIMKGNESSQGFISNRTWTLSDPNNTVIRDPENPKKIILKESIYGYNYWISEARRIFDNPSHKNEESQKQIEAELNSRISNFTQMRDRLKKFNTMSALDYSSDLIKEMYSIIEDTKVIRFDENVETFIMAYLNVLYEARKYFINKRCNKQDGTLWICRHLEKMIPQALASLVDASNNIDPGELTKAGDLYNVAFYEVQNKAKDRVNAVTTGKALSPDRIKTVYIKVEYSDEEGYLSAKKRYENHEDDEQRVLKVRSWSYVKNPDGSYKKKITNKGERLKNGWVVKDGPYVYPIKPENGDYRLESREFLDNEEVLEHNKQVIKTKQGRVKPTRDDIDEAIWPINWNELAENEGGIIFNLFGGTSAEKLKDLTIAGVTDPVALLCGAKEKHDYWVVQVETALPRATGFQTDVKIKKFYKKDEKGVSTAPSDSPSPLIGAAAYAMWPIIEEQASIIPNAGDFALKVAQLS